MAAGVQLNVQHEMMSVVRQMRNYGLKTVSFALDIWTANYINTSFACLTASFVDNDNHNGTFEFKAVTLAFSSFGSTSHTSKNIKKWIESVLTTYGLKASDVVIVSPDAAANGLKALKMAGLDSWTCLPHKVANAVKNALGIPSRRKKLEAVREGDEFADGDGEYAEGITDCPPLVVAADILGNVGATDANGTSEMTRNPIVLAMIKNSRL